MTYRLLDQFRQLFDGVPYKHRASNNGAKIARCLYEDLATIGLSRVFSERIANHESAVSTKNRARGIRPRRGDGTLGDLAQNVVPTVEPGFVVARGKIVNLEIGVEVKILAKAMIKQIGRVENDLRNQIREFQSGANNPICVGIVGINHAAHCIGIEGDRVFRTDGTARARHPVQEASEAARRLREGLDTSFDELLFLSYRATNEHPYCFSWVDEDETQTDYASALARISRDYDTRFGY